MIKTAAKGKRLELKSIRWLLKDGAKHIFRAKGQRKAPNLPGVTQIDLIVIYTTWQAIVEVTTPSHASRARKRLQEIRMPLGWTKMLMTWADRARSPVTEAWNDEPSRSY